MREVSHPFPRWISLLPVLLLFSSAPLQADPYPFPHPSPLGPDWRMQDEGGRSPPYPLDPLQGWPFGQRAPDYNSRESNRRHLPEPGFGQMQRQERIKPKPDREEALRKALVPPPDPAVQRQKALGTLFEHLQAASDEEEAKGLAQAIQDIWLRSSSVTATLLMARALVAIQVKNYPLAEEILDKIIVVRPDWAEAWSQRAKTFFLMGNFQRAMADVDEALRLEPRQFEALTTMGVILEQTGLDSQALTVLRKVLALYPHQKSVEAIVKKLTLSVEGRDI